MTDEARDRCQRLLLAAGLLPRSTLFSAPCWLRGAEAFAAQPGRGLVAAAWGVPGSPGGRGGSALQGGGVPGAFAWRGGPALQAGAVPGSFAWRGGWQARAAERFLRSGHAPALQLELAPWRVRRPWGVRRPPGLWAVWPGDVGPDLWRRCILVAPGACLSG